MRFLVICRPVAGGDTAKFRQLVPAEGAALRDLKDRGVLTAAWSPGRPGAVLMLDAQDEGEATRLVAGLPLAREGLITTEVMALLPMEL